MSGYAYGYDDAYGYSSYGYGAAGYQVSGYVLIHSGYGYYEVGSRLVDGASVTYAYYINPYGYAYQTYYGGGYYSDVPFYNIGDLNYAPADKFDPFQSQYGHETYTIYGSMCYKG